MDRPPEEEEEPRPSTSRAAAPAATFDRLTCHVLRMITTQSTTMETNAVKVIDWHANIQVANPAVICTFQEVKSPRDPLQLTDLNLKGRCSSTLRDSLRTDVCNFSDTRLRSGSNTMSVLVFALPLVRVPVTGIHLFRGRAQSENRPPRANARVTIRRAQYMWTVKVNLTGINWSRRRDSHTEGGQFFTSDFTFATDLMPLTVVDAMDQLACSDADTYIQKAETVGEQNLIRVYIIHLSGHPPAELFLQMSVYSHRAEVICRHNPAPFFERHAENGFLVRNPHTVNIPAHHTHVAHFNNAIETQGTCHLLFFPIDIPGLSIEAGPLTSRMKITLKIQNLTQTAITVNYMQMLGFIHFFPRGSLATMPNRTQTPRCSQTRLRAGLFPRDVIMRGVISQFVEQNSSSSEEEEEDEPVPLTPPILTEAIFAPFQSENDSTSDEDEEEPTTSARLRAEARARREAGQPPVPERPPPTVQLLSLPCWNMYIHTDLLLPITARIEDTAVKATSYLRSELEGDICTAADLQSTFQELMAPLPARRSPTARPRI
ncbi:tegument protein pp71 [Cercopithecine betaherpesvirus 5]|uniref:Tegument protein pp71 n=1 Tax=Simian cytomegalovirus (strain Colburn) TaxID=50292 RepID=G8XTE4_SCMVC|nr:tegument protein pp71 [Cercopithecine betaherpesvirus 5]AEV80436.1 tegument protein pp71 [Cercopithecine betaherpesvirus 5]